MKPDTLPPPLVARCLRAAALMTARRGESDRFWTPTTDDELAAWVREFVGVTIPAEQMCEHHCAPLQAFADAYFARFPRTVWKASRGFGGKTVLLAALAYTEAVTLGAGVSLLGGSGAQSENVHNYLSGTDSTLPNTFWDHPNAPRHLLRTDPTAMRTRLSNGGWIRALMASQKSVRGPHPQRLRGDEIDEMDAKIWDGAQGQPMEAGGVADQVVGSSTHQHADGTMTRELRMAAEKNWPVYEWCYRETMQPNGFLTPGMVERKRVSVPVEMWNTEFEGQEPSPGDRAIETAAVEELFDPVLGVYDGKPTARPLILEPPAWEAHPSWNGKPETREQLKMDSDAEYAVGADWGKLRDHTIVFVLRTDVEPIRVVAYLNMVRLSYPIMFEAFNAIVERYEASSAHDATGLGTVADDYVEEQTEGVTLVGARRSKIFSEAIVTIENRQVKCPRIEYAYNEFKYATGDDLYTPSGHPPDTFIAFGLAVRAAGGRVEIIR